VRFVFSKALIFNLCLATRPLQEGPATKKTVLKEEETETPDLTMSAVQAGGEGIKMTKIDTPDTIITVEETTVAIIEALTANVEEKIKMTMTGTVGAEVETA